MAALKRFTNFYTRQFERRPLKTLTVANCILSGTGDAAAQVLPLVMGAIDPSAMAWDFARTARFLAFGAVMAPLMGKWNHFIEHAFPLRIPPKAGKKGDPTWELAQRNKDQYVPAVPADPYSAPPLNRPPYEEDIGLKSGTPAANPASPEPPVSLIQLGKRLATDQLFMAPLGLFAFIMAMSVMEGLDWEAIKHRFRSLYIPVLIVNWQVWPIVQLFNFRYMPLKARVPFAASCGILWTVFISYRTAQTKKEELQGK